MRHCPFTALFIAVPHGQVFQTPRAKFKGNSSQFELSSVPATIKRLFNLSSHLTRRDAWAGSFDELIMLSEPRTDTPLHLPEAPADDSENATDTASRRRLAAPAAGPRHCSAVTTACAGIGASTLKQRRQVQELAWLTRQPEPDMDAMSFGEANRWLDQRFAEWTAMGDDPVLFGKRA